jgi:hypothetical protein
MEESKQGNPEADQQATDAALSPLDMEDSLQHDLADTRFMGIRHHHVMRTPEELISFRQLLLRWRHNSFYIVSYCAGLLDPEKTENGKHICAMRLRVAKRIAAKTAALEASAGDERAPKNRREIVVTLANCKQDRTLKTFPLFCNHFNLLYFDIAEVAALEKRFPEILLSDPTIQNRDPLYTTTEENINRVAPLALYYWHCINGSLGMAVNYIDDTQEIENYFAKLKGHSPKHVTWGLNDGIHYPHWRFKKFVEFSEEMASPTLPYELPLKFKRSRKNELQEFSPLATKLAGMGIADARNRAKIIYSLFPQLSHGEIGRLLPASPDTQTSSQTDRDRGRWLLGLK